MTDPNVHPEAIEPQREYYYPPQMTVRRVGVEGPDLHRAMRHFLNAIREEVDALSERLMPGLIVGDSVYTEIESAISSFEDADRHLRYAIELCGRNEPHRFTERTNP